MNKKLIIGFTIFCMLVGLYFLNVSSQKKYTSSSSILMEIQQDIIKKILIHSSEEAIELVRKDTIWSIAGNDTLIMKQQSIDNFFNNVLNIEIEQIMTQKKEKWLAYNIDDSTGTHLAILDWNDNTVGYFVFGRSNSDYSRCYVRGTNSDNVFLTNKNVMYHLQTSPTYWGEPPKEDIPEEAEL